MIDLFDLYNDFCSRVNTFQGGSFRLQEDFIRNVNAIYFDIWDRETRNSDKSQEAKDNVIEFNVTKNIKIPQDNYSNYGAIPLPKDYGRLDSVRIVIASKENKKEVISDKKVDDGKCFDGRRTVVTPVTKGAYKTYSITEQSIELVNNNQWAGCLSHLKKYPTLASPKMAQINGSFQVAPKTVTTVVFSYYQIPSPAILNVTYTEGDDQNGNGDEVIYNKDKSTPILLPINLKNEFLWRLGVIYGFYTREQFLAAFANEQVKQDTNA